MDPKEKQALPYPEENSPQIGQGIREFYMLKQRYMFAVLIVLMLVTITASSLVLLLPPIQGILNRYEQLLAAQVDGMKKIPDLESKLAKLESQLNLLTTESIDTRMKSIENAIHVGKIQPTDVASLNDLKSDFQQLKTYMFRDPRELVELKELQTNYRRVAESLNGLATKEGLEAEVSGVRNLLYLSLGFFGILFTVFFSSWWFVGRQGKRRFEQPTTPVSQSATSSQEVEERREQ